MPIVGQTSEMSCGAACLLCAALELNTVPAVHDLPATEPLYQLITLGVPLAATQAWLTAIYAISGAGETGYSLPSGILRAARYLGMTGSVIMAQTKTMNYLQKQYPHEIARCLNDTIHVGSSNLGDLTLQANERALHCVRIGATAAVHWVMQRADNTYMDPAGGPTALDITHGGADRASRTALKSAGQSIFSYHGTGLAVKLS